MVRKCKWCGKEFEPNAENQVFCGIDCSSAHNYQRAKISNKIKSIAKKFDFEVKNESKIINAKLMIFRNGNVYRCPCDAQNPKRYCGSAQCIADTVYNGHCHCNLFHKKED
jgi:1-aminocyclopropane-1-carboxylate deaminase/D-cysteine desulfhydrase-like pyridoxal-dependent ACC family enzyme